MNDVARVCKRCGQSIMELNWYSVPSRDGFSFYYTHYHTDCYINRNNPEFIDNQDPIFEVASVEANPKVSFGWSGWQNWKGEKSDALSNA